MDSGADIEEQISTEITPDPYTSSPDAPLLDSSDLDRSLQRFRGPRFEITSDPDRSSPDAPLLDSSDLDRSLQRLDFFLLVIGLNPSSPLIFVYSCCIFLILGFVGPAVAIYFSSSTPACDKFHMDYRELCFFFFDIILACISSAFISINLFRYGMKEFLSVEEQLKEQHGNIQHLQEQYAKKIKFEDYSNLMRTDIAFLQKHMSLRDDLSKMSHRFSIYFLLLLLVVTASQVVTLFVTTDGCARVDFTHAGDLAVSSFVHVVGIVLCLLAASKITHRAQGISSLASKWHAEITCASERVTNSQENSDAISAGHPALNYSENDLEAVNIPVHTNANLSPYNKRQALVMYFLSNPGGFNIFGWTIDSSLIDHLFFVELSIILFVLGKILSVHFTK